jgi:preprotein translocase subunit SecF
VSHFTDVYRGYRVPRFRLVEHRNRFFVFSAALIVLSLIGLIFVQLTFSIDFTGGAQVSYPLENDVTAEEIQHTLADHGFTDAEVQIVNTSTGREVAIRTEELGTAQESAQVLKALADQAGVAVEDVNVETIGPTWGAEISRKALLGLVVVLIVIALYITVRFQWTMAIGAMVALVHDVVITAGVYALTGRELTPETVIAILTILGFSLYDTVVIYDKVKENTESPALVARLGWDEVVNLSLNQTIMRSVNTSLVVLLPILSLLLFGGQTLKDFAFAMFVGVAIGAYSSIFIAAPILVLFHHRYAPAPGRRPTVGRPTTPARRPAEAAASSAVAADAAATSATASQGGSQGARRSSSRPRPKGKRSQPAKRKRR